MGLLLQDMNSMVKTVMAIEREVDEARSIQDASAKDKRKESQPSSPSSGKKHRTSTQLGFQGQGRDYQGQGQDQSSQDGRHFKAPSQQGQRACFQCHQPGYLRWDYPRRQGSQGYGTPQSQSSVEHAQTQFVPPYPIMG